MKSELNIKSFDIKKDCFSAIFFNTFHYAYNPYLHNALVIVYLFFYLINKN